MFETQLTPRALEIANDLTYHCGPARCESNAQPFLHCCVENFGREVPDYLRVVLSNVCTTSVEP